MKMFEIQIRLLARRHHQESVKTCSRASSTSQYAIRTRLAGRGPRSRVVETTKARRRERFDATPRGRPTEHDDPGGPGRPMRRRPGTDEAVEHPGARPTIGPANTGAHPQPDRSPGAPGGSDPGARGRGDGRKKCWRPASTVPRASPLPHSSESCAARNAPRCRSDRAP